MTKRGRLWAAAALVLIGVQAAQADYFMRAIDYDTGDLYAVDPTSTNAGIVDMGIIGSTGVPGMADIWWDPADLCLYGYTTGIDAKFYRIDADTAAASEIGSLNIGFVFEGALCEGPNGSLYGTNQGDAEDPHFFTVDKHTGAATVVNTIGGLAHDVNGMVLRDDGWFAGLDRETDKLLIFNPANGFISNQISMLGIVAGEVGGMTRHFSQSYLSTSGPSSAFPSNSGLYTLNPNTGEVDFIGVFDPFNITGTGISGIAVIPEPASMICLALGVAATLRSRIRRNRR